MVILFGARSCCLIAASTLVLYDHDDEVFSPLSIPIESLGQEFLQINQVWAHSPNLPGVLVLFVRYFTLITRFLDVFVYFYPRWTLKLLLAPSAKTNGAGTADYDYRQHLTLGAYKAVHSIMALRVYALYYDRRIVLLCIAAFFLVEVGVMAGTLYTGFGSPPVKPGNCLSGPTYGSKINSIYWAMPFVGDTTFFILTVWKCAYRNSVKTIPLLGEFLRGGSIYYVIIGIMHITNLFLFIHCAVVDGQSRFTPCIQSAKDGSSTKRRCGEDNSEHVGIHIALALYLIIIDE
ncbi:hypothetical protein BU17DRAFT_70247 [Hysterangium stoloniferum]|nr:hypothetical protein BU17DRAFT_70247 [Hysterangium stoloniferum]